MSKTNKDAEQIQKEAQAEQQQESVSVEQFNELLERLNKLENEKNTGSRQAIKGSAGVSTAEKKLSERVKVKLFKDGDKYKDDVFVGINGKGILIKRGVEVEIERKYALLLDQSQIQSIKAAEMMEREESRFANENA